MSKEDKVREESLADYGSVVIGVASGRPGARRSMRWDVIAPRSLCS
jgi:hypothetical protein